MTPSEKRKQLRRSMRYPASIDLGEGVATIPCTLCGASQEGAQLLVNEPDKLPDEFSLVLGYDGSARRSCRVAWRSETQVGVEWVKPPKAGRRQLATPATREQAAEADDALDIESLPPP